MPTPKMNNKMLAYTYYHNNYTDLVGYDLAKRGEIPVLKFGGRVVVPKVAFEKMLKDCSVAKDGV